MNDTAMTVFSILAIVFDLFTTVMYYNACMRKENIRVNKFVFYLVFLLAFASEGIFGRLGLSGPFYAIKSFIVFWLLSFMWTSKQLTRIFTALSYLLFGIVAEMISYVIINAAAPGIEAQTFNDYGSLVSKLFNFAIAAIAAVIIKRNTRAAGSKERFLSMITPLISIFIVIMISFGLDTGKPQTTAGMCFAAAGITAINLIVFYLLESITEASELRETQNRMEQQFAFQEQKYEQTSRSFKSISSVIHDTNKHLVYLDECLEHGEYDEAKKYIRTATEHIDSSYKRINTGYLPVDALVSNALNISEANNIRFKSDIKIEKERINIERYDLCVALGNMLDNAVEACGKVKNPDDRYVCIVVCTDNDSLYINIENSAERLDGAALKTDKNDKLLHGYGISNINAISEKYGGVFTIERRESSCEATLIIPI